MDDAVVFSGAARNLEELRTVASFLAPQLRAGDSVGLSGELGAGKTTFVKFLAQALGIVDSISSPTYVLCHEYSGPDGTCIEHWDLYRVSHLPDELFLPCSREVIRLIEWFDRFPELSRDCRWQIKFSVVSADERRIEIRKSAG